MGNPWSNVDQGSQISKTQFDKIMGFIASGKREGALVEAGGERNGTQGYFIKPTVFSGVKDDMRIAREEIFGPVQSIIKFNTIDEVIGEYCTFASRYGDLSSWCIFSDRANATPYGLASGVLTSDISKALTFAHASQAGSVWVNCFDVCASQTPFGGYKQSGQGRELGPEGIQLYLETKTVTIAVPTKNS